MSNIPPEMFGRDHFSALLYAETRAVDYSGNLDTKHLRRWGERGEYRTTLRDGKIAEKGHDDISCLRDLESAGLLVLESSLEPFRPYHVTLTDLGWYVAGKMRRRRAQQLHDSDACWEDLILGYPEP